MSKNITLGTRNIISIAKDHYDKITKTLNTIDYAHHEIHAGSFYSIDTVVDLAGSAILDVRITTPDITTWTHMTFSLNCESETDWELYEDAVISTAGTNLTAINHNRNSANTTGNTIDSIENADLTAADADTDVSGATKIAKGKIGAGNKSVASAQRNTEIILKQGTTYTFRITATAAGYTDFIMNWYEHTNK